MKKIFFALLIFIFAGCSDVSNAYVEKTVDVDLTVLNAIMLSGELNNIFVNNPNNYIGKTIKVNGTYTESFPGENNEIFHFVLVYIDSCCTPRPIMFFPAGEFISPELGTQIEVTGIFNEFPEYDLYYLDESEVVAI